MPWVRFIRRWDWKVPGGRGMRTFRPGQVVFVRRDQAEGAIRANAAVETRRPKDGNE